MQTQCYLPPWPLHSDSGVSVMELVMKIIGAESSPDMLAESVTYSHHHHHDKAQKDRVIIPSKG